MLTATFHFMDCFWSQSSGSGAQLTILGAQLRKAALHAAGMLVLIQGLTDVLGGLLFNAASALVLPGCLGLAEQAVPV